MTLRTTVAVGKKLQQLAHKWIRVIAIPKVILPHREILAAAKITNAELRRKHCIQAIYATRKRKPRNVYRWRTAIAPAYLNNKLGCGNEHKVWEQNWYRVAIIKNEHVQDGMLQGDCTIMRLSILYTARRMARHICANQTIQSARSEYRILRNAV